ncbi:MAG: hypothetical protein M1608_12085 [Candidatus Omnitrophica bacterium]|nr:hypothetical protein [Candidatus Omnitrophota bacterium]
MTNLSVDQLKRAVTIRERIEALEVELRQVLTGGAAPPRTAARRGKRTMSSETREKISASRKALYAARKSTATARPQKGPHVEDEKKARWKANIAKSMKERWARIRAEKKA